MIAASEQLQLLSEALPPNLGFSQPLRRAPQLRVLQLNLGKLCNMRCHHCHVDAGPHQGDSQMSAEVVAACQAAMERLQPQIVDLTGGAPELHQQFRQLVQVARALGLRVIDRCNLSVLLLPAMADLAEFLASHQVEIVASLPSPEQSESDAQRGDGSWAASIQALRLLNQLGYGQGNPQLPLTLMSNPNGTALQRITPCEMQHWRQRLAVQGVKFDALIGLNNMPIARFLNDLQDQGNTFAYLEQLRLAYNPASLCGLMCRDTLSVAPDGSLYDCDFNQMLSLPLGNDAAPTHITNINPTDLAGGSIRTANHCFGCTAGQGSSCSGATSG
jgi:radical SAM/Cys-rich protein